MSTKPYTCPSCGSDHLHVYERTAWVLNGMEFFCHSVKAHDHDADVECQECSWTGERRNLNGGDK